MPAQSPVHAVHTPLVDAFFDAVYEQERTLLKAGFAAQGAAGFLRSWFGAWLNRDVDAIVGCCTDDVAFIDPGTGGLQRGADQLHDYTSLFYEAVPDMTFYPQDGANVLPYWDFTGKQARVTLPWRAIGRFSGSLNLHIWPRIEGTNRCFDFVGIDRYLLTEDFKIARIDTDYDNLGVLRQVGLVPDLTSPIAGAAAVLERLVAAPLLKLAVR